MTTRMHTPSSRPTPRVPERPRPLRETADQLMQIVYEELRRQAEAYLRRERVNHTLAGAALVHEAYLRMVEQRDVEWQGPTHFKAVAAQAMRRVLVDHARGKNRAKRGGGWHQVALDDALITAGVTDIDPTGLEDALERMRELDERQARVIELRLLGGMSVEEAASTLGVSARTVERDWKMGLAWLRREIA